MLRSIFVHGLVAGLIVGLPLFGVTVAFGAHGDSPYGAVFGYLTMLIALSAVFVAIKRRRDLELGGVIGFWPAFGLGLGISFVASVLYVAAWEAALAVTGLDFAGEYARAVLAREQAAGASAQTLSRLSEEMARFRQAYADPLQRLAMTFAEIFPVGALVSLICAALLRNPRFLPGRR